MVRKRNIFNTLNNDDVHVMPNEKDWLWSHSWFRNNNTTCSHTTKNSCYRRWTKYQRRWLKAMTMLVMTANWQKKKPSKLPRCETPRKQKCIVVHHSLRLLESQTYRLESMLKFSSLVTFATDRPFPPNALMFTQRSKLCTSKTKVILD